MSDYAGPWRLTRTRFVDAIKGLSQEQLNWRMQPGTLTIGEMALHVAGVEVSFSSQLVGLELDAAGQMLKAAATDGVVNDKPFPFKPEAITPGFVEASLKWALELTEPVIEAASPEVRAKQIVSALGPVIDGDGAFARLGYHAGYHQGQTHFIVTAPGFPK